MAMSFRNLSTSQFEERMRPYVDEVLRDEFPGCEIEPIAEDEEIRLWADKNLAIDRKLVLPDERTFTVQQKCRRAKFLYNPSYQKRPPHPDFTQEYMNGAGTSHEAYGEWFHLHADLYFYGWANEDETAFDKWILLDVWTYKRLVWKVGGLSFIGDGPIPNGVHGRATFYAIPVCDIAKAIIRESDYREDCSLCQGRGKWSCPVDWRYGHGGIPICSTDCQCPEDSYHKGIPECTHQGTWSAMPKMSCSECHGRGEVHCDACLGMGKVAPTREVQV